LSAVLIRRRLAATALLGVCLGLGACSSVAGVVTDNVPTWAGGMPKDVPPRPGAPGYEEFISHQQRQDAAATGAAPAGAPGQAAAAPAATGTTPAATAPATNPMASRPAPQQLPPAYARPDDPRPTNGGLY
jgi:hypothetical protein